MDLQNLRESNKMDTDFEGYNGIEQMSLVDAMEMLCEGEGLSLDTISALKRRIQSFVLKEQA
jgi:hypothetical protein